MKRRNFLGSLLGTVIATPFFARLDSEEWQRVALPYRVVIKCDKTDKWIQAPGVAAITQFDREYEFGFKFIVEPLAVEFDFVTSQYALLAEQGKSILSGKFHCDSIACKKGDILKMEISLVANSEAKRLHNINTPEDLTNLYLKYKT